MRNNFSICPNKILRYNSTVQTQLFFFPSLSNPLNAFLVKLAPSYPLFPPSQHTGPRKSTSCMLCNYQSLHCT